MEHGAKAGCAEVQKLREKYGELHMQDIQHLDMRLGLESYVLANVYHKTNLPLNKHLRHQKCLFRGRFVL